MEVKKIKTLIARGRLEQALDKLIDKIILMDDEQAKNDFIHQSGRLKRILREKKLGIESSENVNITINQISSSILSMLDDLAIEIKEIDKSLDRGNKSKIHFYGFNFFYKNRKKLLNITTFSVMYNSVFFLFASISNLNLLLPTDIYVLLIIPGIGHLVLSIYLIWIVAYLSLTSKSNLVEKIFYTISFLLLFIFVVMSGFFATGNGLSDYFSYLWLIIFFCYIVFFMFLILKKRFFRKNKNSINLLQHLKSSIAYFFIALVFLIVITNFIGIKLDLERIINQGLSSLISSILVSLIAYHTFISILESRKGYNE